MTAPILIVVDVPRPEMTANDQRRWHWSKVRTAKARMETHVRTAAKRAKVPRQHEPVDLAVTWFPPDRRHRDGDSLGPFVKAAQDALVKAGVLVDDDSRYVRRVSTAIGGTDRTRPRIEIRICPAEEANP
ncbi:MAG: RusA family crossover junction endodeoxyribonuclease [Gordonia sp. (in: high G+C Gram-positive bacteria)]